MHSTASESDAALAARRIGPRATALLLALITAALLTAAWQRRPDPQGMVELLPADHPAVRLDAEITADFGMQNPIVWVIEARQGTVWRPPLLAHVQELTQEVFTLPGVVPFDVLSIASPNLRDVEVTDGAMQPTYVMADVPQSAEELAALRRRVESNPNYHGVFVSRDGRAAMIVADFAPDVDGATGAAALALRDRHRDAETMVYAGGKPVIPASIRSPALHAGAIALLLLAAGVVVLALVHGMRFVLGAALAAALTVTWTVTVLALLDAIVLPWTALALLPALLLAAVFTAVPAAAWPAIPAVAGGLIFGFVALALITESPARAFGAAMAVSLLAAILAAAAAVPLRVPPRKVERSRVASLAALLLIIVALPGLVWLRSSFSLAGYAGRYLPPAAAADLRAIGEHFPPPVPLAARIRGEPGFIESPAVLATLDAMAAAAREDTAVVRAMSVADLVKLMHRVFNGDREEFFAIPDERAAVARYLTLGYSPGFRTFVDRAFSQTAVWAYLSSEAPADVARVRAKMAAALAGRPLPPGTTVDMAGGEGALILTAASMARRLALGAATGLLVAAVIIAVTGGLGLALRALGGGLAAAAVAGGIMGWTGVPIDLISLPFLIAAGSVGSVIGALSTAPTHASLSGVSLALIAIAAPTLVFPYPAARLAGATLLAMALVAIAKLPPSMRNRA
jgi:predicted RND superfamily exporter protein